MVGLRLHIVNETLIRNLKSRATGGKGAEFSLVRKQLHFWTLCVIMMIMGLYLRLVTLNSYRKIKLWPRL